MPLACVVGLVGARQVTHDADDPHEASRPEGPCELAEGTPALGRTTVPGHAHVDVQVHARRPTARAPACVMALVTSSDTPVSASCSMKYPRYRART